MKWWFGLIPLVLFSALVVFFWRGLSLDPQAVPSALIGSPVPDRTVLQLKTMQPFSTRQLPHQVMLLHVWASWCERCQEESVVLLSMAQQGVLIYGLNYKDTPRHARRFLARWGDPYAMILHDSHGRLAMDLGVYGTPETFLIDRHGIIRYRHVGVVTPVVWQNTLLPLIRSWEARA